MMYKTSTISSAMDISLVKQKILDLAVTGKLIKPQAEDLDITELLLQIQVAKRECNNSKKFSLKIEKSFLPPFPIPSHWRWVRLCDVTEFIVDCPHTTAKNIGEGYALIRTPNVGEGELILNDVHRVSYDTYVSRNVRAVPQEDDIIYAREAPAGNAAIIGKNQVVCLGQRVVLLRPFRHLYNPKYLVYALIAPISKSRLISKANGSTGEHVNLEDIRPFYIPFPPKNEQDKIVATIDKCFEMCKKIESQNSEIFDYIHIIRSNYLNTIFLGRGNTNNQSDEPAELLLRRISPNIKIIEESSQYTDIPNNWAVCRLEDIVDYEQPNKYIVSSTNYSDEFKTPVLTAGKTFILGYTNETENVYGKVPVIIFDDFTTSSKVVNFKFKVKSSAMKILTVKSEIELEYVAAFMQVTRLLGDSHKRMWISEYSKLEIPIPPIEEQKRIVRKIKALNSIL